LAAANDYLLPDPATAAGWSPQVLDIGFGYGESVAAAGRTRPGLRVLGVEVHGPGVLRAMEVLTTQRADPASVRLLRADVLALLPLLAPGSLRHVQALHPDPWPKRRHLARRLFDAVALARLSELLCPGGTLLLVTDDPSYAAGIRAAAAEVSALRPWPDATPPPETRYGARARAAGRPVHELAWWRDN